MDYIHFDDYNKIGEQVRYYRKKMNMTQAELAAASGTSRSSISALEKHNHRLSLGIMMNIADCLGIPMPLIFKSEKVSILRNYVVGKTIVKPDGIARHYRATQVCCDFVDDDTMICVSYGEKCYIADTCNKNRGRRLLCARKSTGELFVISRSKLEKEDIDDYFVVAAIFGKDVSSSAISTKYLY